MGSIFLQGMLLSQAMQKQQRQTDAVKNAEQTSNYLRSDVKDLQEHVQRLCLLNQSLWELVSDRLKISESELEAKVREVDLRDGVPDGKMTEHPLRCPQCGRVSNSRHKKCLYCGLLFEGSLFG